MTHLELTTEDNHKLALLMEEGCGLFRNGFIVHEQSVYKTPEKTPLRTRLEQTWERVHIGSFDLRFDPQAPVRFTHDGDVTVCIIGDVYCNRGSDIAEVMQTLARTPDIEGLEAFDLGGRFACLKFHNDRLWVFNDAIGSRSVYYTHDGRIIVSSHLGLIQNFFTTPLDPYVAEGMRSEAYCKRIVRYLPGDLTICQCVYRLTANHVYDSKVQAAVRYWPKSPMAETTLEDVYETLERALARLVAYVQSTYRVPVTSLTGGVDCRAIVAALRQAQSAPYTMTWRDLNYQRAETPTVEQLRELVAGQHYDVRFHSKAINQDRRADISLAAHFNCGMITSGVRALCFEDFKTKANIGTGPGESVFINGYGGEIIRAFYEKKGRANLKFTNAEKMAGLYGGVGRDPAFHRFVLRAFKDFRGRTQFSPSALKGYSSYDVFYWEHRTSLWAVGTMDGMDVVLHSLAGFNSRDLFAKAISLQEDLRLDKSITLNFITKIDEELGQVPVV